jgi:Tol biopolymer transport system component
MVLVGTTACTAPITSAPATPSPRQSAAITAAPTVTAVPSAATSTSPSAAGEWRGVLTYSSDVGGNDDIYVVRFDGSAQPAASRLTDDPEKEFDPDLSPDGSQIAYRRNPAPGSDNADIWVMNLDGTGKRNLTNAPQLSNWAPTWTPDGRIAFSRASAGGVVELWTMDADGSMAARLAQGWCEYAAPSPDGSHFVCAAAAGRSYDLVVVDAVTGERRAITNTLRTEFGPSWSRDGAWIAFSRDMGDRWELLVVHPDGTGETSIASEGVFSTWEPNNRLVWSGPGGINVADADGTNRSTLDYPAGFVSWEP